MTGPPPGAAGAKQRSPAQAAAAAPAGGRAAAAAYPMTLNHSVAGRWTTSQEQHGKAQARPPQHAGGLTDSAAAANSKTLSPPAAGRSTTSGFADNVLLSPGKRCRLAASGDGFPGAPAAWNCAANPPPVLKEGSAGVSAH